MPSPVPYLSRANKRFVKKLVSLMYATVTIAMITVFVRDWTLSWRIETSAASQGRSRQLRSVQFYTEIELVPGTTESKSNWLIKEPTPATEPTKTTAETLESASTSTAATTRSTESPLTPHKTTLTTRAPCNRHYFLLILVSSSPAYFDRRAMIRQTWASDSFLNSRWKTVFLLGRSENYTEKLQREEAFYGDLIRADYHEDYWNQTFKIEMGFEWADRYCSFSFLLKADDDVFINTPAVFDLLSKASTPKEKLYMGFLYKNPVVQRKGKWMITREEYNETHFPDFCAGPGFILSRDVVRLFVDIFDTVPKFKIDDVYVGMLAKIAGVTGMHNSGFQTPPYLSTTCVLLNNTLVRHGAVGECLLELYRKSMPTFS